jgi:hypothetical protein
VQEIKNNEDNTPVVEQQERFNYLDEGLVNDSYQKDIVTTIQNQHISDHPSFNIQP